jgi:hypothetical protein
MCGDFRHQSTVTAGAIFDETLPVAGMIGRSVVTDQPRARRQRVGSAARAGAGKLSNRLAIEAKREFVEVAGSGSGYDGALVALCRHRPIRSLLSKL